MKCPNCEVEFDVPKPHTERQAQVLKYITDFQAARGHWPSYGQVARHLGVGTRSTVAKHVQSLRKQGFFPRDQKEG